MSVALRAAIAYWVLLLGVRLIGRRTASGLRIERSDVMTAVRQRGLQRLEQVRYAIVERDGKISIVEQPSEGPG